MKVRAITVGGFRNVERTRFELGGIVGLVSPNNYGKSNVLEAIDFGIDFITASAKERRAMMSDPYCIPLVPSQQDDDYEFLIEVEDEALADYRYIRYGYRFSWARDDGTGCRIVSETLECSGKPKGLRTSYLKRGEGYRARRKTRSFRRLRLDDDQLAVDVLTAIDDIEIAPVVRGLRNLRFDVAASVDASSRFRPSILELKSEDGAPSFDAEDLAKQLYRLREEEPDLYERFEDGVFSLFPEFEAFGVGAYDIAPEDRARYEDAMAADEELPFKVRDEFYRISVKSAYLNQPLGVSMMSSGTQRVIWLLANTVIASGRLGDQLLAVEEIETSIHPRMIHDLLELLNENLGSASLLVTSHSPYLVQYLRPERLYIGAPNETGTARFRRIAPHMTKEFSAAARAHGMGDGEYLYSLMCSDQDGAEALLSYLED